jgi:hypothetical protein
LASGKATFVGGDGDADDLHRAELLHVERVAGPELPLLGQAALDHDLARPVAEVAPVHDRVAAAPAEDHVQDALPRAVVAGGQAPARELEPVRPVLQIRQRADALLDVLELALVEARDDVRQVGLLGGAVEAGGEPVSHGHRHAHHDGGGEDPEDDPHASTSRPSCRKTTRSALAVAAGSWVTITTARPSSALSRRRRSTSAPAASSRLPVGSSARTTADR